MALNNLQSINDNDLIKVHIQKFRFYLSSIRLFEIKFISIIINNGEQVGNKAEEAARQD